MFDFSGKIVMITGAGGGIGVGLCHWFHAAGATVIAFERDRRGLAPLFALLPENSERLVAAFADLTILEDVVRAVKAATAQTGAIDILINNAGAAAATALANLTPAAFAHDLAINLSAPYYCVEAVKDAMIARGAGIIVNIGSVNGLLALGHPAYSAAKAGLISYTKSLAIEYGPMGIRANIVCPGTVKTQAWTARADEKPEIFDDLRKWYPLRDFAEPCDIALATAFLASDAARMITGVVLPVDAGLTAGNPVLAAELTLEVF